MIYVILGLVTVVVPVLSIWAWEGWKKYKHNKLTDNLEDLTFKYSLVPKEDGFEISSVVSELPLADRLFIVKMAKVQLFTTQRDGAQVLSEDAQRRLAIAQDLLAIHEIELEDMLNGKEEQTFTQNVQTAIEETIPLEGKREKL